MKGKQAMTGVLIDTSAWIEFLRGHAGSMADSVQTLLELQQAHLCGPVKAELLQGAKGSKEKEQLQLIFEVVPSLQTTEEDWIATGEILQSLRSKGITLPLTDALIASIAKRHQLPVLTLDQHFSHLEVHLA